MMFTYLSTLFAGLIMALSLVSVSEAQITEPPKDSVIYAYLPYLKYASDTGLEGGLVLNRYHYADDKRPFKNHADFRVWGTTKGLFSSLLRWDFTESLGTDLRSRVEIIGERRLGDVFFPIGHDSEFNQQLWDSDYYFFDSFNFDFNYEGRHPLQRTESHKLDFLFLSGIILGSTIGDLTNRSIGDTPPVGIEESAIGYFGLGLVYDSRDNEFDPTRGIFHRSEIKGAPGLLFDYKMAGLYSETRGFYSIEALGNLTVAGRVSGEFTTGEQPYWILPEAAGEFSVRGFARGRFRDQHAIVTNLELRKWLFGIDFLNLRFGLTAFTDSGRVFAAFPGLDTMFSSYNRAWGGGLTISAFTPDFIVRIQSAHSDEMGRFYMNIGFAF